MGGTPKRLEIGMYVAVAASAAAVGGVILMLHSAYGIGSETISAPQANMMSMIVKGIMDSQLPWIFVIVGVMFAVMCELMKIPVLPFALGLYLPMGLSTGVFVGGVLRWLIDGKYKKNEAELKEKAETGTLLASGLIAGEAIIGILIAVFAVFNFDIGFGAKIAEAVTGSPWTAALMFLLLCIWFYNSVVNSKVSKAVSGKPNMKA